MKKIKPGAVQECLEQISLLQKENPLTELAQTIVEQMLRALKTS